MSTIDTSRIIPTHNRFRNPEKAKELILVKEYCDFILNNQRGPIILIQTEDDQLWCHDGHHRLAAIDWHYGKIDLNYVDVHGYSYKDLDSINLDVKYVTPYDPRIECRLENFWEFKKFVLKNEPVTRDIIDLFHCQYKEPRTIHTMRELCNTVLS